jgi:hypothetical protein
MSEAPATRKGRQHAGSNLPHRAASRLYTLGHARVHAHPHRAPSQRAIPRYLKNLILLIPLRLLNTQRKRPPIIRSAYRSNPLCLRYDNTN